jgi:glycerol-3-phosphate O-acyltransferase
VKRKCWLSWIYDRGYTGISYSNRQDQYGLPGHSHEYESCHIHDHIYIVVIMIMKMACDEELMNMSMNMAAHGLT